MGGLIAWERFDSHGETFDFLRSWRAFRVWALRTYQQSEHQSFGPVWEMHRGTAVGALQLMTLDASRRAIYVVAEVTDDRTWERCLDGTLSCFSIGGTVKRRIVDGLIRFAITPREVSLVTRGAIPGTKFRFLYEHNGCDSLGGDFRVPD